MIDTLAEETTTLPEGAILNVSRCQSTGKKRTDIYTELRAVRDGKIVKMRVTDVGPSNLSTYLLLFRRAIERRRAEIKAKPQWEYDVRSPADLDVFVQSMAFNDMFIFEALGEADGNEPQPKRKRTTKSKRDKGVPGSGKAVPDQPGKQNNNPAIGSTTGTSRGNSDAAASDG